MVKNNSNRTYYNGWILSDIHKTKHSGNPPIVDKLSVYGYVRQRDQLILARWLADDWSGYPPFGDKPTLCSCFAVTVDDNSPCQSRVT